MTEKSDNSVSKALTSQLEKNINILEQDYNLMVFRIQATLSKVKLKILMYNKVESSQTITKFYQKYTLKELISGVIV